MPLQPGARLGPYEIQTPLGAGGMGEVYRATDTRLRRTVALKVLLEAFAADPERRQRLEREARIASGLNHPNICTLHDVGEQHGTHYLVMEYLEGITLEQRLEKGRLPLDQALAFSIQIADALDKAHRRGVVHRDLKPGNVMVTPTGVKLLDFGLAMQRAPVRGATSAGPTVEHSERITTDGAILGTLQYMAPEQLEGQEADARTDIFAFGALVYEMVTGARAFEGGSQAALISVILRDEPRPIGDRAPDTPPLLSRTISRCLSKDRDDRWQTANDLLFQLRSVATSTTHGSRDRGPGHSALRRERVLWTTAVIASILASIVGVFLWTRNQTEGQSLAALDGPVTRFTLFPADGTSFYSGFDMPFALSPDGRFIVYVGVASDGAKQLWLRPVDAELAQPVTGTDGAHMPFWSPDSQWIGFFTGNTLRKIRSSGGLPQTIATGVVTFGGAAWSTTDVILFTTNPTSGLSRVSAQGGPVSQATTPGPTNGAGGHLWPQFLGDGDDFIYVGVPGGSPSAGIYVASLGGEAPRLLAEVTNGPTTTTIKYVPGYILFVGNDGGLFAHPFDEERREFSGEPVRLLDGIPITGPGRAPFSASATGMLAYWPYAVGTPAVLQWFERDGRALPAVDPPSRYIGFSLSPDARQLAFSRVENSGRADLWIRDLTRGSEARLTSDGGTFSPVWSPDGTRIAYSSARRRPPDLFIRNRATGEDTSLGITPTPDFPSSWSPDGQSLVSVEIAAGANNDLLIWQLQPGQEPTGKRLTLSTQFNETLGRVSPDGRQITYVTDESGRDEVWVATFPSGENRRQVSVAGGSSPEWGARGEEILYISAEKQLMATPLKAGEVGTPRALFDVAGLIEPEDRLIFPESTVYAVTSNGQRFLMAMRARDPNTPPISVVLNWPALLRP